MDTPNADEQEFNSAFAEFTGGTPAADAPPADAPPADAPPADAPPADAPPADAPPADAPPADAPPADAPPADAPPADAPPADAPPVDVAALQAELAALRASKAAPAQPPAAPAPAATQEEATPVYTAEEQALVAKYREDWPDIAAGEALLRRAEYKEVVSYVFQQVQEYYAPMIEFYQARQGADHYSGIVGLVPDYDVIREKALAWIETQPEYLKAAYKQVVEEGEPKDVADIVARFKAETKYAAAPVIAAPAPTPALAPAAMKAAAALAVVKSARTEQVAGADDNDFTGAFAEFARKEEAQKASRK